MADNEKKSSTSGGGATAGLVAGGLIGNAIGGIGIAAMGTAIGIPAAVVTGVAAVGGMLLGDKVEEATQDNKK